MFGDVNAVASNFIKIFVIYSKKKKERNVESSNDRKLQLLHV